jgi:hypothetical protein
MDLQNNIDSRWNFQKIQGKACCVKVWVNVKHLLLRNFCTHYQVGNHMNGHESCCS